MPRRSLALRRQEIAPPDKKGDVATHDAVIVGARCAGSVLAGSLAVEGWKVLLIDKAHFPRDFAKVPPAGHSLHLCRDPRGLNAGVKGLGNPTNIQQTRAEVGSRRPK